MTFTSNQTHQVSLHLSEVIRANSLKLETQTIVKEIGISVAIIHKLCTNPKAGGGAALNEIGRDGAFVCSPLPLNLQMEIIDYLETRRKMLPRSSEQQSINGLVLNS